MRIPAGLGVAGARLLAHRPATQRWGHPSSIQLTTNVKAFAAEQPQGADP